MAIPAQSCKQWERMDAPIPEVGRPPPDSVRRPKGNPNARSYLHFCPRFNVTKEFRMIRTNAMLVSVGLLFGGNALAQDAMKHDAMKKDAMGMDSMANDSMKKGAMASDCPSSDAMGKDSMKKDSMSKDTMSKDGMKKDDGMMKKN